MTTLKLITKRVTIENIPNSNVNMVTAECIALDLLLKQLPDEVLNVIRRQ